MTEPNGRACLLLVALLVLLVFGMLMLATMCMDICGIDYQLPGVQS